MQKTLSQPINKTHFILLQHITPGKKTTQYSKPPQKKKKKEKI